METRNVLSRIRSSYKNLSKKEQLVADYILKHPEKIIHSTINQIAEDLMIADATVFRFCKNLGFKGYQAFKIALASEIVNPIKDIHETINENDTALEITHKVFQSNIKAIELSRDLQTSDSISKAIASIVKSRNIHFYGNGGSGIVGLDAQHKFMRTGLPSHAYTDGHLQLMSASQLDEQSVAVFISHSGSNKDLLEVIEVVKHRKAKTIGITNFAKSPLSKLVDICLYTASQETEYRSEALASRIAELTIIDVLYVNYSMQKKEQSKQALSRMRQAISHKRL